jgi:biotin carboxyl carrier protein
VRYEIEAGGRVRRVTVDRTGGTFAVTIDGRVRQVDAVRIDAHRLSLIVDSPVSAESQDPDGASTGGHRAGSEHAIYETVLAPESGTGRLIVRIGVVPVTVSMTGHRLGTTGAAALRSGPLRIVAPMPGKIVRVLVRVGDRVHPRQPIVVIEAMKMENELRADRDGTVAEIQAREGTTVESGATLVVIQ